MTEFSPREIVSELDRFIVGQHDAKRAVAIALRNRWRRLKLQPPMREEVMPKNILMIGPPGCGKTEISRRLATLAGVYRARLNGSPLPAAMSVALRAVDLVGEAHERLTRNVNDVLLLEWLLLRLDSLA